MDIIKIMANRVVHFEIHAKDIEGNIFGVLQPQQFQDFLSLLKSRGGEKYNGSNKML